MREVGGPILLECNYCISFIFYSCELICIMEVIDIFLVFPFRIPHAFKLKGSEVFNNTMPKKDGTVKQIIHIYSDRQRAISCQYFLDFDLQS